MRPDYKPSNDGGVTLLMDTLDMFLLLMVKMKRKVIFIQMMRPMRLMRPILLMKKRRITQRKGSKRAFSCESLVVAGGATVPLDLRDEIRSLEEKHTPHLRMEMLEDIRDWTMDDVLDHRDRLILSQKKEE